MQYSSFKFNEDVRESIKSFFQGCVNGTEPATYYPGDNFPNFVGREESSEELFDQIVIEAEYFKRACCGNDLVNKNAVGMHGVGQGKFFFIFPFFVNSHFF